MSYSDTGSKDHESQKRAPCPAKMAALLSKMIEEWPEAFNDGDMPGPDACDSLVEYIQSAKAILDNPTEAATPALLCKQDSDYILQPDHNSVWIEVDSVVVKITRTDVGAEADFYHVGKEGEDALSSAYAFYDKED